MTGTATYTADEQRLLVEIPVAAIAERLERAVEQREGRDLPDALQQMRASFVTLRIDGELRGCCGSLRAFEPLHENVARSGCSAAFSDPRFSPLQPEELPRLSLHISVLNPPEPMEFTTEDDLLAQLRPGVDGVMLSAGKRQGVFLPSVWEQLSGREEFLWRLKQKAGLPEDYWSAAITAQRFTCESIHGAAAEALPGSRSI